tara:strand:+ start:631 stop:1809 length:1179 start_codon:yes stop_codon:yes gene_type:complete
MGKHLDSDILAVLRSFEIAGEFTAKRSIKNIKEYPARTVSRLLRFSFEREQYYLLFDNSANDDVDQVLHYISLDAPGIDGALVRNPKESTKAYGFPLKGKDAYLFKVTSTRNRLDQELVRRYPALSRSTLQKYIKAGHVLVNGVAIQQPKVDVLMTDEIAVTPPEAENHNETELPILYIDDDVIVVNKPAGILTHSKGVINQEFTVADFFRRYTTAGLETTRPGIVHRLDRDTSGVIIGARNQETVLALKKQFAERTTKKEYIAVIKGLPKETEALIDLPISRNPSAPSTFRVFPGGKEAQTSYKVLATTDTLALVRLQPRTGRTHQLRVHMQYLNTPILGDRVYGGKSKSDRLCLHAYKLEITIPNSKRTTFTAPVPGSFTDMFEGISFDD